MQFKKSLLQANTKKLISLIGLILLLAFIFVWQFFLAHHDPTYYFADQYKIISSCGIASDPDHAFTYGLYYWGLFPLFPQRDMLPSKFQSDNYFFSKQGADEIFNKYAAALKMDINGTFRSGIMLPLWLPYFQAIIKGSIRNVSTIPFNAGFFIVALLILLINFWVYGKKILGVLLVLFMGSYPFQLYAVYRQDNIFGYMLSCLILITGIFSPFIFNKKITFPKQIALCLASGLIIAFAYLMRTDCLSVMFGSLLVLILYRHNNLKHKLILGAVIILTFVFTTKAFYAFMDFKFQQSQEVVEQKGGSPFIGRKAQGHVFWHTIWCGMHDFDTKYGHAWQDPMAELAVKPVLREKYNINPGITQYYNKPVDYYLANLIPEYELAMRDLVLSEIANDPLWYISILSSRIKRIFNETLIPQINLIFLNIKFINSGLFFLGVLIFLILIKSWNMVNLVIFSASSAIIPIAVTSGMKFQYYSALHLFLTAIALTFFIKFIMGFLRDRTCKIPEL